MKMLRHRNAPAGWLTAFAIAVSGFPVPATATIDPLSAPSSVPESSQVAQATGSLCRQVTEREGLAIRDRPDPNAAYIGGVDYNGVLTLAPDSRSITGPDGRLWLEITAPVRGYVSNGEPGSSGNLAPCSGTASAPTPSAPASTPISLCRRIDPRKAPQGIRVHADTSRFSTDRGGLAPGAQVLLVANYRDLPDSNREPRTWVEISSPVAGYISTESLIYCNETPAASSATVAPQNLCRQVDNRFSSTGAPIRADATSTAAYLGVVPAGGQVRLIPDYRSIPDKNGDPRQWVQISTPVPGFIGTETLIMCR